MGKVIDEPTFNDAQLLVQLYAMYQTGPIRKGFLWYLDNFKEDMDPSRIDFAAIAARHPRISEGYDGWTSVASFFETVGVLVRNDQLYGGLVYERWPVEWYWRYLGPLVQIERAKGLLCDTACFADNFEWLAEQAKAWRSSDQAKAKWLSRLSREKKVPEAQYPSGKKPKGRTGPKPR
jgi:hypothetical protein